MKLYRLCCQEEIDAIKKDGFEKLTFGGCLFRYAGLRECIANDYAIYKKLWQDVKSSNGENRIEPILKCFPDFPKEIPLFERDILKRKEICKKFEPNVDYLGKKRDNYYIAPEIFDILNCQDDKHDEIFLLSIKVVGFFDNVSDLKTCYCDLNGKDKKVLVIDFPQDVALQFKGEGKYPFLGTFPEYALPMFMLKSENIVDTFEISKEESEQINENYVKSFQRHLAQLIKQGEM